MENEPQRTKADTTSGISGASVPTPSAERRLMAPSWGRVLVAVRGSLALAVLLLASDVVLTGGYLWSIVACPIWFLWGLARTVIGRPGWRIALVEIAIPAATLGLILCNTALQWQIAEANADRIIAACEQFHAANGSYPGSLEELVPRYLSSVPRAKNCMMWGGFLYLSPYKGSGPRLIWYKVPGANGTAAWGARVWADRSGRRNSESAQTGNAARHRVLCGVGEISAV